MQFFLSAANLKVLIALMMALLFIAITDPVTVAAQKLSGSPFDVAVDSNGNIYVVYDSTNQVAKLSPAGAELMGIGSPGAEDGQFSSPKGVGVDRSGNIIVADTGNDRIQVFNSAGAHQLSFGHRGDTNDQFNSPEGVGVDRSDNIIVADTGNSRIQVFKPTGVHRLSIGGPGRGDGLFNYPRGVAGSSSDSITVADTGNRRIQLFNSAGVHRLSIGSPARLDSDWLIVALLIALISSGLIHYKAGDYSRGLVLSTIFVVGLWAVLFFIDEARKGLWQSWWLLDIIFLIILMMPAFGVSAIAGIPFDTYRRRKIEKK
jgi:DNA-binding beta-propeller fold protein YncE